MLEKKKKIKSILWQFYNYVFSFGVNFLVQILLARLILPEDFGFLAILNTIIAFADIFVQSGVSTAIVQKKQLEPKDIFTAQVVSGLTACMFCLIIFLVAPFIANLYNKSGLTLPLRVLGLSLIFNSINSVFSALLIRRMKYKKLFLRNILVLPVAGIVGVSLAFFDYGIWALIVYQMILNILTSFIFILTCDDKIEFKFSKKSAGEIYRFGLKILFTNILNNFFDIFRTLIVGVRYSKADLAYYDRAQVYSKYTVQIADSMFSSVALPIFSQQQEFLEKLKEDSRKIVRFSAFVMFPVLMGAAGVSKSLTEVLLTEKWNEFIPFFIVFCFIRLLGIVTNIDKQMFYSIGRSDLILKYTIIYVFLSILTLFCFFPFGVFAIAINTLIMEILISIVISIMTSKFLKYSFKDKLEDIYKPFINSLMMFVIIILLDKFITLNAVVMLSIQIIIGMLVYLLLAFFTKDINLFIAKKIIFNKF